MLCFNLLSHQKDLKPYEMIVRNFEILVILPNLLKSSVLGRLASREATRIY